MTTWLVSASGSDDSVRDAGQVDDAVERPGLGEHGHDGVDVGAVGGVPGPVVPLGRGQQVEADDLVAAVERGR